MGSRSHWKAWLLVFIFVGGFLARAAVYSQGEINLHAGTHLSFTKSHTTKTKRRIEHFGFSKIFLAESLEKFLPLISAIQQLKTIPPNSAEPPSLLQPPC